MHENKILIICSVHELTCHKLYFCGLNLAENLFFVSDIMLYDGAMSSVACGRNEGDTGHVDSVYWSGIARWSTTS